MVKFVMFDKKPIWFWKIYRWVAKKIFKQPIVEIRSTGFSTDFGSEQPYSVRYAVDMSNRLWLQNAHHMAIKGVIES